MGAATSSGFQPIHAVKFGSPNYKQMLAYFTEMSVESPAATSTRTTATTNPLLLSSKFVNHLSWEVMLQWLPPDGGTPQDQGRIKARGAVMQSAYRGHKFQIVVNQGGIPE